MPPSLRVVHARRIAGLEALLDRIVASADAEATLAASSDRKSDAACATHLLMAGEQVSLACRALIFAVDEEVTL